MIDGTNEIGEGASPRDPELDSLDARLARAQADEHRRAGADQAERATAILGARSVAQMMVGYPLGGIVIGFGLDKLLGTTPWITIGLMFLAFIAACYQVMVKSRG